MIIKPLTIMTITLNNIEPLLDNPEELLNDLIEDGWTMKDALTEIMRDAIIENRLSNSYPDYVGVSYEYDEDEVTIELEKL